MDKSSFVVPVALHAQNLDKEKTGSDLIPIIAWELGV